MIDTAVVLETLLDSSTATVGVAGNQEEERDRPKSEIGEGVGKGWARPENTSNFGANWLARESVSCDFLIRQENISIVQICLARYCHAQTS